MREYALGFMGMSPKEYDCITFYDFQKKLTGFSNYQKRQDSVFREVAYRSFFAPYQDVKTLTGLTREKFWRIYDKELPTSYTKDRKEKIKSLIQKMSDVKIRN